MTLSKSSEHGFPRNAGKHVGMGEQLDGCLMPATCEDCCTQASENLIEMYGEIMMFAASLLRYIGRMEMYWRDIH